MQSSPFPSPHLCGFSFFLFSIRRLILLFSACPFGALRRPAAIRTVGSCPPFFTFHIALPRFSYSRFGTARFFLIRIACILLSILCCLPLFLFFLSDYIHPACSHMVLCQFLVRAAKKAIRKNNFRIASKPPSETSGYRKKACSFTSCHTGRIPLPMPYRAFLHQYTFSAFFPYL